MPIKLFFIVPKVFPTSWQVFAGEFPIFFEDNEPDLNMFYNWLTNTPLMASLNLYLDDFKQKSRQI